MAKSKWLEFVNQLLYQVLKYIVGDLHHHLCFLVVLEVPFVLVFIDLVIKILNTS